jgi:23S rRNA pseudouridine2605 synthase
MKANQIRRAVKRHGQGGSAAAAAPNRRSGSANKGTSSTRGSAANKGTSNRGAKRG